MQTDLELLFKENNYALLDQANDAHAALTKLVNDHYDLLILDLSLPNTDMLGLIGKIRLICPQLPVLSYSSKLEYTFIKRYLTSGVNGYCFYKWDEKYEILVAIKTIISGKWYISREMVELIVEDSLYSKKADRVDSLNEREFEVFSHLVKGETLPEIAQALAVHSTTVSLYKARIMDKLRITNLGEMQGMMKTAALMS